MTSPKRSTDTGAIAEAINTLNSRIEKTEHDFIGHLQKVEDRLDQIVELTKTVAVLQQQSIHQTDQISEIRAQLRDSSSKFDNSITRIHTRLDDIVSHQKDKLELHAKDVEIKIENVKSKTDKTAGELSSWLNRGIGAWAIFVFVIGLTSAGFYRWVDSIEKEKAANVQITKELLSAKDRAEIFIKQHELEAAELKAKINRIEAGQRDLEDMIIRRSQQK